MYGTLWKHIDTCENIENIETYRKVSKLWKYKEKYNNIIGAWENSQYDSEHIPLIFITVNENV